MFFKKKKNPNSDAFANTTPIQQVAQPQPQQTSSADEEISASDLLEFLDHTNDNEVKTKTYILLAMYHHNGTNGAPKDLDKAVFYAEKAIKCDDKNPIAHYYAGCYLLEKALKASNNDDIVRAIISLVIAHLKGNKDAYNILSDVAKTDLFNGVNTADELIDLFIKAAQE